MNCLRCQTAFHNQSRKTLAQLTQFHLRTSFISCPKNTFSFFTHLLYFSLLSFWLLFSSEVFGDLSYRNFVVIVNAFSAVAVVSGSNSRGLSRIHRSPDGSRELWMVVRVDSRIRQRSRLLRQRLWHLQRSREWHRLQLLLLLLVMWYSAGGRVAGVVVMVTRRVVTRWREVAAGDDGATGVPRGCRSGAAWLESLKINKNTINN